MGLFKVAILTLLVAASRQECGLKKYRSIDGTCNNLVYITWGESYTVYERLIPPIYSDGKSKPAVAKSGNELPDARIVSMSLYPDYPVKHPLFTLNAMQFGQLVAHDMGRVGANVEDLTPIQQVNNVTHFLDLSLVYGNTNELNHELRSYEGGRLKVETRNGQDWPPNAEDSSIICSLGDGEEYCYLTGDTRANQSPELTVLQVIYLREHNRVADRLSELNPCWDDEQLFQEARRIVIAEHQAISYTEYLPLMMGRQNCIISKINYASDGYVEDYNSSVNPSVLNEHASAAQRFFHTLIAGNLELVDESRKCFKEYNINDIIGSPAALEATEDNFDGFCRGLATQHAMDADRYHTSEITQFFFKSGEVFGFDLKETDIARSRANGVASYNDYREYCGLMRAKTFEDLIPTIREEDAAKLRSLYESPDDIDLNVGGSLEVAVPEGLMGPTFYCIMAEQFTRTRQGDRFWYEGTGSGKFTLPQLREIRKASVSRLLCDNGKNIKKMQPHGFQIISEKNKLGPCEDLPEVLLSEWEDENCKNQ